MYVCTKVLERDPPLLCLSFAARAGRDESKDVDCARLRLQHNHPMRFSALAVNPAVLL
jgi:hypothetical protein